MALKFVHVSDAYGVQGTIRETFYDVTLDSSYPTGGYSIAKANVGLTSIIHGAKVIGQGTVNGVAQTSQYRFEWDFQHGKLQSFGGVAPAGTISAPVFTGTALAAHGHVLHFQTSAAANAVTAAANQLRTAATAFDVASVANNAGEGGIVQISAGTPAGTNSAPTFTGTATAGGGETPNATDLSNIIVRIRFVGA